MKKLLTLLFIMESCLLLNAQFLINLEGVDFKGSKIEKIEFIPSVVHYGSAASSSIKVQYLLDGKQVEGSLLKLKSFNYKINNLADFWQNQAIQRGVYENLEKNGYQYDLRQDIEIDVLNFLNDLERNNFVYKDQYLENYLYSIIYKVFPDVIMDGRPGSFNIIIIKDIKPNASMAPNGTLTITTGLISTINSEEELVAIIAHEVSHYVLDHALVNINKAEKRQRAAEFWAGFATVIAAVAETYAATQNEYYTPGAVTYSMAVLSYTIASQAAERLGLEYSREQETEADNCAVELMKFINVDPTALSSVLFKIKNYSILTGNYIALSGEGTHPTVDDRIKNIGYSKSFSSPTYDKTFSSINSLNAISEYNSKHFKKCQEIIDRNIIAGVPTEDDYILKAMTNLCLFNTDEKNIEALELINKAKSLNLTPPINLHKEEALVYLRLQKNQDAIKSLETYANNIKQETLKLEQIKDEYLWNTSKSYLEKELEWTFKMIYKVKNL